MIQQIQAIYEDGVLRPLFPLSLKNHAQVQITIDDSPQTSGEDLDADPLLGLEVETGISDLAENFDDYRFHRRQP